jgi:hypothetical protein
MLVLPFIPRSVGTFPLCEVSSARQPRPAAARAFLIALRGVNESDKHPMEFEAAIEGVRADGGVRR